MRQLDLVCFVVISAIRGLTRDFWGNCLIFCLVGEKGGFLHFPLRLRSGPGRSDDG